MLLKEAERPIRLQGAFISNQEIDAVVDFIRRQEKPHYILHHEDLKAINVREQINDELFSDVAYYVVRENACSINSIQKQFEIGFNRAQKIVTFLEQYNIVSSSQGTKSREVLMTFDELEELLKNEGIQ